MILPSNILKCLRPEDRKSLGKAGMLPEEAILKMEAKTERQLQNQIISLLRFRGIEPIVSRFGKKTTNNAGTPDIIFAVRVDIQDEGRACAWEIKLPDGKRSKEQEQMAARLLTRPNAWHYKIIRSVDEALETLRAIGVRSVVDGGKL